MRKNKMLILLLAILLASFGFVSCKDTIVAADQLPAPAQTFLEEYFPANAVSYVKKDREIFKTTYEVFLVNGEKVEFNKKGEWDKVNCKNAAVPAALVPAAIAEYVQASFPGQLIVKIDKEPYGYEVELFNDLELKFDKNGQLRHIDD